MVAFSWVYRALFGRSLPFMAALVVLSLPLTSRAHAQSNSAAARSLFVEARSLMKTEKYESACAKLEESLKLDSGMGTQFNLAHCWEKLGKSASAWALFLDVAAAARAAIQPKREAAARARAQSLVGIVSKLRVDVTSPVAALEITRDDVRIGAAAWGSATPIDPASYSLRASAPGYRDWSKQVRVPSNGATVAVVVPPLEKLPLSSEGVQNGIRIRAGLPGETPETVEQDAGFNLQQTAGLAGVGLGVAGGVAGVVFSLLTTSASGEAGAICNYENPDEPNAGAIYCNPEDSAGEQNRQKTRALRLYDDARRWQDSAIYSYVIGGGTLLLGAVLYFTAKPERDPQDLVWAVAPLLNAQGPSGAQVHLRF